MNIDQFVAKYRGTLVTVTGPDSGECTAVPHAWSKELGLPIVYGHAKDTFKNAAGLPGSYETVVNGPSNFPPPGAIVVFDAVPGNPFGHTAFVIWASAQEIRALSQNDPKGSKAAIKTYDYDNDSSDQAGEVIGWFIPKGGSMSTIVDRNLAIKLGVGVLGRNPEAAKAEDYLKSVVGQPLEVVLNALVDSQEAKNFRNQAQTPKPDRIVELAVELFDEIDRRAGK